MKNIKPKSLERGAELASKLPFICSVCVSVLGVEGQLPVSVLTSIQVYWSKIFSLPKNVPKEVDAILRKFLWSAAVMRRVTAKVAWSEICLLRKEGGLGIPSIAMANKANMAKHL